MVPQPVYFRLFPSLDNSPLRTLLLDFFIECEFSDKDLSLFYKSRLMCKIGPLKISSKVRYFGDSLIFSFRDVGFQYSTLSIVVFNNSLMIGSDSSHPLNVSIERDVLEEIKGEIRNFAKGMMISFSDMLEENSPTVETDEMFENTIKKIVEKGKKWIEEAPKTNQFISNELWNYMWNLHRVSQISLITPSSLETETLELPSPSLGTLSLGTKEIEENKEEILNKISPWALLHIIDDILWYKGAIAKSYLFHLFRYFQDEKGMLKNHYNSSSPVSFPPLHSAIILDVIKYTGDIEFATEIYPYVKRNLKWWEENRFNSDFELFGWKGTVHDLGIETTMLDSPRFLFQYDGRKWSFVSPSSGREMILVDLNAQMCDFYQNAGIIAMLAEELEDSSEYFASAERLQDRANELLWDKEGKFFYDFDLEMETLQPIKSIAGFWPLYGGLALKSHLTPLLHHLLNPKEFWSEIPIPSISMDEKFFGSKLWSGSVSISHDFWIMGGLKRYNLNSVATRISEKIISYLNNSFELYGSIYELYPPLSFNVNGIKQINWDEIEETNGDPDEIKKYYTHSYPNQRDCLGYVPLHSLFFRGMLGGEILDEKINFVPDWTTIKKDINFSFHYRGKLRDGYLSRLDKKILEYP